MEGFLIISITGLFSFITGLMLLKRENRLFDNSKFTIAKVVKYYEYESVEDNTTFKQTMYTMAVEYTLMDGTLIHAREQSGSSGKKYPVGTEIEILYSGEKPDMFIVKGDHSRKVAFIGMIIFGILLMALSVYVAFNN